MPLVSPVFSSVDRVIFALAGAHRRRSAGARSRVSRSFACLSLVAIGSLGCAESTQIDLDERDISPSEVALVQAATAEQAQIKDVRAIGTGCSEVDTRSIRYDATRKSFRVQLTHFSASVDPSGSTTMSSDCTLRLTIAARGARYAVGGFLGVGEMSVEPGMVVIPSVSYMFGGVTQAPTQNSERWGELTNLSGVHTYSIRESVPRDQLEFSSCSSDRVIDVDLYLTLMNQTPKSTGFVALREAEVAIVSEPCEEDTK